MACGTTIVSTNTGWPVEAIRPFENGILTEIDDVEALIKGVKWFLDLPDVAWEKCSENAYATTAGYSWDKSAAIFEAVLAKYVAEKSDVSLIQNDY